MAKKGEEDSLAKSQPSRLTISDSVVNFFTLRRTNDKNSHATFGLRVAIPSSLPARNAPAMLCYQPEKRAGENKRDR
jgi:hypothetical protein